MSTPILTTKLYIPAVRPNGVPRPHLIERLNTGLQRKLMLVSAPAGFGKTTLVGAWAAACNHPVAWLSLDSGDNNPARFVTYCTAALQTVAPHVGEQVMGTPWASQSVPIEQILTLLLNDLATIAHDFVFVIDDYHVIDAKPIDDALAFLLEHLPPRMHLVIVTREDPNLPLARLRVRGQLTELRATMLRFSQAEAADFLNRVMGLTLSAENIAALETRTEGWVAGLQLAALALQGATALQGAASTSPNDDSTRRFIASFTGSHRFVLDYLVEEVLHQQPAAVQAFLLQTAILDRLCGPLCDAVLGNSTNSAQQTLEYLEHANLFIVPLDDERCWYRYHHLFVELLRQRLQQDDTQTADLHIRASRWYETNDFELEAFRHATAANDVQRAERLIEGNGVPLHFRGEVQPILSWLDSLPSTTLDAAPALWTTYGSVLLVTGQIARAEQALQSAEIALEGAEPTAKNRDLIGRVAAIRSTLAASSGQIAEIIPQSRRALAYLHPDNLSFRTSTAWKLGYAYQILGDRAAARKAYEDVIATIPKSGEMLFTLTAKLGLGGLLAGDGQLHTAADLFRQVLLRFGDSPLPMVGEAHLGLGRLLYDWNQLDAALEHAQKSVRLTRQMETSDRVVVCELLLARIKLVQGDVAGADALVSQTLQQVRQRQFTHHLADTIALRLRVLLLHGDLAAASKLLTTHSLPSARVRLHLAQGEAAAALALIGPLRQETTASGSVKNQLEMMILHAIVLAANGEQTQAIQTLQAALTMAQPGGFVRLFVDEGGPMADLLMSAQHHIRSDLKPYLHQLLAAFGNIATAPSAASIPQSLVEPLSPREREVLHLIADGCSNREIGERLFLALNTVKGHNRKIFGKLQVQRRTEAVARARELGLL